MNRHNKLTTNYFLLMKKMIRKGKESLADYNNPKFIPQKKSKLTKEQLFMS